MQGDLSALTSGLNKAQKEAVLHKDGALLILAGAGAGKTRVITHRIGALIQTGVAPHEILAVTFTNKAAREMRERVHTLLASTTTMRADGVPFVSTFHSLGVHILKENSRALNISRNFAIFDRSDSTRAVKEALTQAGFDPKEFEPRRLLSAISREKGKGLTLAQFREDPGNDFFKRLVIAVWEKYEHILAEEKALDFDDLLLRTLTLLREHSAIRDYYQSKWKYIHVDEYQDTNGVQYEIIKLLAAKHHNICVVGDIDQNIYSWRGADLEHILHFEKDYPQSRSIVLEQNYRSTKTILAAANDIIAKNVRRKEKNLFTDNAEGDKVGLYGAYDEIDEARFIATTAKELMKEVSAEQIAVLYRANFQSRAIEEAMLSENLPYQVLGVRFFERKEVKDVLSYLRLALGSEAAADQKRVYSFPPRGIGKVTLLKILEGKADTLASTMRAKISGVRNALEKIKIASSAQKPSEVVKIAVKESGIEDFLRKGTEEDLERLENIRELVTLASRYDHMEIPTGLEAMLSDAALQSEQDEMNEKKSAIRLMTVHAAKGLEFEYVFISGLEDGLFPHEGLGDEEVRDNEEERRLFYVALTRARKKVFLSYAGVRTIFGSRQINVPSEFITDIPEDLLEPIDPQMPRKVIYLE